VLVVSPSLVHARGKEAPVTHTNYLPSLSSLSSLPGKINLSSLPFFPPLFHDPVREGR